MTDQLAPGSVDDLASTNGVSARRSDSSVDQRLVPPRRRWPVLLAGVAVGVSGTLAVRAVTATDESEPADDELAEVVELATTTVERRDLVEEVDWAGTLAVGAVSTLSSPATGTITDVVEDGTVIGRGDVVARIDDLPVVALFGTVPMWRDLTVGDAGDDVFQLETNLAALGFDAGGVVTIDDEYTSATSDMVEAWQEALGVEVTGDVAMRDVVVLSGESMASSPSAIGSSVQVGAAVATIETSAVMIDVVARAFDDDGLDGIAPAVDAIAESGTVVEHGTVLFGVDGTSAVAVLDISAETAAVLAAFEAGDIEEIESVLVFIGYDPDDAMEIDDEVDDATAAAVVRWQESVGLPSTGSVQAAAYVVVPGDREYVVAEPAADVGDLVGEGRLIARLASPTLSLTADVVVSEVDEFEVGDTVAVEQVDESTFTALVTDIGDTTRLGQDDPSVTVTFEVADAPAEFVSGSVVLTSESSRIDGAIVVPTRALVTLAEGGFAVERVDDDGARVLVGVELGTFDDGVVEIVGDDLDPGDRVVVPS